VDIFLNIFMTLYKAVWSTPYSAAIQPVRPTCRRS